MSYDEYDYGVNDSTYAEDDETIQASLREIKYQTLRHLTINTGLPADRIKPFLKGRYDLIAFQMVGVLEVWFLRVNKPQGRLYNTGYNSFDVAEDGKPAKIYKAPRKPKAAEPVAPVVVQEAPKPKRKRALTPCKAKFEAADIEQLGFEGYTIKEIATLLDITFSSASMYLYSSLYPFAGQYKRGKMRRAAALKSGEAVIKA